MNDPESKSRQPTKPFAGQSSQTPASHHRSVTRSTSRRIHALAVLVEWLLLAGLPVQPQEPSKKQNKLLTKESGFLGDDTYAKLQPDPGNSDWLIYFKNSDVLKRSDTFVVDPVKVFFVPEVQQRDINPADQAKLEDYFTKAIRNELQAGATTS